MGSKAGLTLFTFAVYDSYPVTHSNRGMAKSVGVLMKKLRARSCIINIE